jgi:predicted dehydrogenase
MCARGPAGFPGHGSPTGRESSAHIDAVTHGLPVLAETPPAVDRAGRRELWATVGRSGLVQVAEQYLLMPAHAARLAAVRSGIIGASTQVQVSSTQQYHAVSLIRGLLGAGHAAARVRAVRTVAPLLDPLSPTGWTDDPQPKPATTTLATLDFDGGRSGVYDFTTGQTRNSLRFRRLLVRGTHGELNADEIVHMPAPRTITRTPLVRRQSGHDLDLNGFDTETITLGAQVLYRNPYPGHRFNDDEIATATLLDAMAAWIHGAGPPPYPLAEAAQDHLLALAIEEAADTGQETTTTTTTEAWSPGRPAPSHMPPLRQKAVLSNATGDRINRRAYLRRTDATRRRPEPRTERIAEMVRLLKSRTKDRPLIIASPTLDNWLADRVRR